MSIQSEFIDFHDRIKLDYDVNTELAEKRDILVKILRDNDELPGFEEFNQGSYCMILGVEPLEGREYNIDVGLRFNAIRRKEKEKYQSFQSRLRDAWIYGADDSKYFDIWNEVYLDSKRWPM